MNGYPPPGSAPGDTRPPASRDAVFVSYRRSDSAEAVGRLVDDLRRYFGSGFVYRDLDSNRPAHDYILQIEEALSRSRVVLAVIGPDWVDSRSPDGTRRLCNPEDLVRLELEHSLRAGIAVIAVLVRGAESPATVDLPASLASIPRLEMCRLRDGDWAYDLGRLLEALRDHGVVPRPVSDEAAGPDIAAALTRVKRYERTLPVPRRRAYDDVVGVVELLRYPTVEGNPEAAQVRFTTKGRQVTVKVVDGRPGYSKVLVELETVRGAVVGGGATLFAMVAGSMGFAGWAALRAWERRFASGFLDNVQRLAEGRGIGEDSSLLPGLEKWRNRSNEV